jgi:hypothetical protein
MSDASLRRAFDALNDIILAAFKQAERRDKKNKLSATPPANRVLTFGRSELVAVLEDRGIPPSAAAAAVAEAADFPDFRNDCMRGCLNISVKDWGAYIARRCPPWNESDLEALTSTGRRLVRFLWENQPRAKEQDVIDEVWGGADPGPHALKSAVKRVNNWIGMYGLTITRKDGVVEIA